MLREAESLRAQGASVMYLAADCSLIGLLAVWDPIEASTPEALDSLRAAGIRIIMATGDGLTTAKAVGASLGLDEVHGEVKPADKLDLVAALQSQGRIVAMAGVGIAMGTDTDVAMNAPRSPWSKATCGASRPLAPCPRRR